MILLTHIILALTSIALATYAFFRPSHRVLKISYSLTTATLATGTYLTYLNPAHVPQACLSGLLYTVGVTVTLALAHRKLARV